MIKRKPVLNSSVNVKPESEVKTPISPVYRIPRKPLSPVAATPKRFVWPPVNTGDATLVNRPTKTENVDGYDHQRFLRRLGIMAKSSTGPIFGTHTLRKTP
ncbi:hypothetical protein TWF718_001875 [Orbilia javanica]|uniref:Uncharacterized protein n=1 Tax=Orbilia javanica TaxID=47235 RepID=A0AAN8RNM0_9PEZI